MYSNSKTRELVKRVRPGLFYLGHWGISREVIATWPLPAGRILFALQKVDRFSPRTEAPVYAHHLWVLDYDRATLRQVSGGRDYGDDDQAVIVAAVDWMQGLRNEDLEPFDKDMVEWLGEMAYRMTPEHLEQFQREYFAIPSDAWGTHENPDDGPVERLADLLAAMGYSEHTITEYLF